MTKGVPLLAQAPLPERNVRAALGLLKALHRHGLEHVVICPGSRSAPLAVAAALLEPHGLELHSSIDERSAAFFALGLGCASGRPAAVITTSGSAVANLLPAAVESDQGTIPLLLLTADRPARLKGCGANQTVNQERFLVACCRWLGEGPSEGLAAMAEGDLERLAHLSVQKSLGDGGNAAAGPVHLNLPFEEPLHPDGESLGRLLGQAWPLPSFPTPASQPTGAFLPEAATLNPDLPGVVVAGPWRGLAGNWEDHVRGLLRWQRRSGWPVLADRLSGFHGIDGLQLVTSYDLLLERPDPALAVPQVLRLGPLPASRRLQDWLASTPAHQVLVSEGDPRPLDPLQVVSCQWSGGLSGWVEAHLKVRGEESPGTSPCTSPALSSLDLARRWQSADRRMQQFLDQVLPDPVSGPANEPWLARFLSRSLPPGLPLMLANSSPVRDWETFAAEARSHRPVHGFRGASGIDGTLSIACGLAEVHGALVLISGDLALFHDANGWLWRRQLHGRLAVVLIDNEGGGLFEQLPIRTDPDTALDFERLFAMPQALDASSLAAVHGVPSRSVHRAEELSSALLWCLEQPFALVHVHTDRRRDAAERARLRKMAAKETMRRIPSP